MTARSDAPYVKQFDEERELTVVLAVDVSRSGLFGSGERTRGEIAAELCGVLAFAATANKDKVGLVLFSDRVELFIPPARGRAARARDFAVSVVFPGALGRRTGQRPPRCPARGRPLLALLWPLWSAPMGPWMETLAVLALGAGRVIRRFEARARPSGLRLNPAGFRSCVGNRPCLLYTSPSPRD